VLVWWWMACCLLCAVTAPSLTAFYKIYHAQGLAVIGFYHHTSAEPLRVTNVRGSPKPVVSISPGHGL